MQGLLLNLGSRMAVWRFDLKYQLIKRLAERGR